MNLTESHSWCQPASLIRWVYLMPLVSPLPVPTMCRGHTELSVALAKAAGITPVLVGCVMLSNSGDEYGALSPDAAAAWAKENGVPFVEGPQLIEYVMGTAAVANGNSTTAALSA